MKNILLLIATVYGLSLSAQSTCETATAISVGLHTVDTVMGQEPPLICAGNGNIPNENPAGEWFTFTADEESDYIVTLNTDLEQNALQDTRVHIYEGNCTDGFTCRDGDDDGGGTWGPYLTVAEFVVQAGETVYIVWDNRWQSFGFDFELSAEEFVIPPPPPPAPVSFTEANILGGGQKLGAVDMNGDFLDDIVSISSGEIRINYQTESGFDFVNIGNPPPAFNPSWSLTAGDIDHNGYNDLIFGGGQGVSFMYANEDGTAYNEVSGSEYVFCQRGNCVDIDNDGQLDVFMCHDVQPNVYYINDGEGNLTFYQGGLGDVENGGNYGSIWVDYDGDGDTDMFIAKCRGGNSSAKINELHRNNGDGTYTEVGEELALNDPIQTWSSAWGDFDNDGDFDILIGASSFSDGEHKLLENNGDGTFTDVTFGSGIAGIQGTGIENVTHDWDNDGHLDLLGMGGTFMSGNGDMTFTEHEIAPGNGPIGDLNNDGFLDIVSGNTLYLNEGNDNNYLVVNTIGTMSNLNGIGAMINVYTPNMEFMRQVRSGDGFRYMSSLNAYFGLGQETEIDSVMITWPSGHIDVFLDVETNSTLTATEGDSPLSTNEQDEAVVDLLVYPNPATDLVFIDAPFAYAQMNYSIFDLSGKMVDIGVVNKNSINISELQTGAYIIRVDIDGKVAERKVVKE